MDRALLIGINTYPAKPLRGCVNDIDDIASFLTTKAGMSPDGIRSLKDGSATASAIIKGVKELVSGASAKDRVLLYYSGHGALFPETDASGKTVAVRDVICPVDFDWTPQHMVRDVDFQAIFAELPIGTKFNWISDSCHSGDLAGVKNFQIQDEYRVSRSFPVPDAIQNLLDSAEMASIKPLGLDRSFDQLRGAFIGACRSDETSLDAEFNGRPNGAFSHFFLAQIQDPNAKTAPLKGVIPNVVAALVAGSYLQHPQLRGALQDHPFLQ